jgi:hypothetical protein
MEPNITEDDALLDDALQCANNETDRINNEINRTLALKNELDKQHKYINQLETQIIILRALTNAENMTPTQPAHSRCAV